MENIEEVFDLHLVEALAGPLGLEVAWNSDPVSVMEAAKYAWSIMPLGSGPIKLLAVEAIG